jgi:hypothetical protein
MLAETTPATCIVPDLTLADLLAVARDLQAIHPDRARRVEKAVQLVLFRTIERGAAGRVWWVGSETTPDTTYAIADATCQCLDYQKRGGPCAHQLAVTLVTRLERREADRDQASDPPRCPVCNRLADHGCINAVGEGLWTCDDHGDWEALDPATPITWELTDAAYTALAALGEVPDLPLLCHRCRAEPSLPSHREHLGADCIARELFGDVA